MVGKENKQNSKAIFSVRKLVQSDESEEQFL